MESADNVRTGREIGNPIEYLRTRVYVLVSCQPTAN